MIAAMEASAGRPGLPFKTGATKTILRSLGGTRQGCWDPFTSCGAHESFGRRWDWQTLREFGGGQLNNNCPHILDPSPAVACGGDDEIPEVWSDIHNVLSSGDAEDHIKIMLRRPSRQGTAIDIRFISHGICRRTVEHQRAQRRPARRSPAPRMEVGRLDANARAPSRAPAHSRPLVQLRESDLAKRSFGRSRRLDSWGLRFYPRTVRLPARRSSLANHAAFCAPPVSRDREMPRANARTVGLIERENFPRRGEEELASLGAAEGSIAAKTWR